MKIRQVCLAVVMRPYEKLTSSKGTNRDAYGWPSIVTVSVSFGGITMINRYRRVRKVINTVFVFYVGFDPLAENAESMPMLVRGVCYNGFTGATLRDEANCVAMY